MSDQQKTVNFIGEEGTTYGIDISRVIAYMASAPPGLDEEGDETGGVIYLRFENEQDGMRIPDKVLYPKLIPILEKKFGKPV